MSTEPRPEPTAAEVPAPPAPGDGSGQALGLGVLLLLVLGGAAVWLGRAPADAPASDAPPAATRPPCCPPAGPCPHCDGPLETPPPGEAGVVLAGGLELPDVELLDERGQPVRLPQLAEGKVVAMNFIFTRCAGVCPPMGANTMHLQQLLGERLGREVALITISLDPAYDTPARMRAWSQRFDPSPHWKLLTGPKQQVEGVLKQLQVFAADREEHAPTFLVGDPARNAWQRLNGLASPVAISEAILELVEESKSESETETESESESDTESESKSESESESESDTETGSETETEAESETEAPTPPSSSSRYFAGLELVDQDGRTVDLHRDFIAGKVVVIHAFFATCEGVCPRLMETALRLQERLGDRLGVDAHIVSITVDPDHDTPAVLKEYAEGLGARAGWAFLSGPKAKVDAAQRKLGQFTEIPAGHSNLFIMGNDRTGLWKKVLGLTDPAQVLASFDSVLEDG